MSANNGNADFGYPTGSQPTSGTAKTATYPRGMEVPRSAYSTQQSANSSREDSPAMSTLTMRAPTMFPSPRDISHNLPWSDRRPLELPSRPRLQLDREELPSIRQIIPDFHQTRPSRAEPDYSTDSYSPTSGPGLRSIAEYVPSPSLSKRRRLSIDDDLEDSRDRSIPRLYRSPPRMPVMPTILPNASLSPTTAARGNIGLLPETRRDSTRGSPPYNAGSTSLQPFEAPTTIRPWIELPIPKVTALALDTTSPRSRINFGEYSLDSSTRSGAQTHPQLSSSAFTTPTTPMPAYPHTTFSYGYQQPRGQSYSGPSLSYSLAHERTPFSICHPARYQGGAYGYGIDTADINDSKQRKRRGNLPKETTDKLRAWFIAHLQHPYPTEDEKQELMRQTNLQMNQISNWFINARRRQLPAMINSARAETDARSARGGDGGGLTCEGNNEFVDEREKRGLSSDGDVSGYDDEFELRARRAMKGRQRDSI